MRYFALIVIPVILFTFCSSDSNFQAADGSQNQNDDPNSTTGCDVDYPDWKSSPYVLPYPVSRTYRVNLSHCTSSYHRPGSPDQFGIDFDMGIGTFITAAREGEVVHIEESGYDGSFPNNIVIVKDSDNTYAQYMHLTNQGALVDVGDLVTKGDTIGLSGSTGLAGYPHLHFIVTIGGYMYPYTGIPYNFSNTSANPKSLKQNRSYTAKPY